MRDFSRDYLAYTRRGMWEGDREALEGLRLSDRERILDVGCGTGVLTDVLTAEAPDATVIGCDADVGLLETARDRTGAPVLRGDATRLPVRTDAVDLVVCQALLVNLPAPETALREFRRVSTDLVAAIEPDNAGVVVESTVDGEAAVERRAREAFIDGVDTDVALGRRLRELFSDAGLTDLEMRRYYHEKRVEPPYADAALVDAGRKANGAGLADHETELRRVLSDTEYDDLRSDWRAMGRTVVEQMGRDEYRRVETVPFDVVVGRVGADGI